MIAWTGNYQPDKRKPVLPASILRKKGARPLTCNEADCGNRSEGIGGGRREERLDITRSCIQHVVDKYFVVRQLV
jgi:hypothetical protein